MYLGIWESLREATVKRDSVQAGQEEHELLYSKGLTTASWWRDRALGP